MAWTSVPQSVEVGYSAGVNCFGPPIAGHFVRTAARPSIGSASLPRIAGKASSMDRFLGTYPGSSDSGVKPAEAATVVAGGVVVVVVTVLVVNDDVAVSVICETVRFTPEYEVIDRRESVPLRFRSRWM